MGEREEKKKRRVVGFKEGDMSELIPTPSFAASSLHYRIRSDPKDMKIPTWWNSNEQLQQSISKNLGFKVDFPPQLNVKTNRISLQQPDQESSKTESYGHSYHEVGAVGGLNFHDQCVSPESGQGGKCGKDVGGQIAPVFLLSNPANVFNSPQVDNNAVACRRNPYADPHVSALFSYGSQAILPMGSRMVGIAPARVPLPVDLAEDGPIYVNAKQYHGILRRRESRAKLEAQNKLIKSRKPYLHESRHLHAVNRVRGSGGRFLSKKKLQQSDPNSDITSVSNDNYIFGQPDGSFSSISPHMNGYQQCSGELMCGGAQHCASIVR